uniref:U14-Theraphotoxin-Ct1a_1 n=1 Tax=Coremiocnemis tropix TaxID=1904443 RepID=A0A482ZGR8_CORTR
MKVSVLITLAILGVMFVWTSAAEQEEYGSDQRDSPSFLKSLARVFQSEERDCKAMFGGCEKDEDCCPHLGCRPSWPHYCGWDGTFRK